MARNSPAVELEKLRVFNEVLGNCDGQLRYSDLARKIQNHPAFAGVRFTALSEYVRRRVLQKNGYQPTGKTFLGNGHGEKPVNASAGFDAIKNGIQFRDGVSFGEVRRIEEVVEQIRSHYELLETENQKLIVHMGIMVSGKTAAGSELPETRCHNCETYRAECDAKVAKVNGANAQLAAKIHEQANQLTQMRDRLRKNALAV